jgi:hypothetical protein
MEPQIKEGDRIKLVKLTPRTKKIYPSLKIGDEGTFVRIIKHYDVITNEEPQFYCIDWGKPIIDGSNTGLCVRCNEERHINDPNPQCKIGQGSYIEPREIVKC